MANDQPILSIQNLSMSLATAKGPIFPVRKINLNLYPGKIHALVGESGCGKSMTALNLLNLLPSGAKINSGKLLLYKDSNKPVDLLSLSQKEWQKIRGNQIGMIFQEPMTSLNPVLTIGYQIMEGLLLHQNLTKKQAKEIAIDWLFRVGIQNPQQRIDQYPHQLSGGMRQRVMIAMALCLKPKILIADEPTTALDVTIQAQILDLMIDLIAEMNMSLILITHDFGVVFERADEVSVMYAGQIVEQGLADDIFENPAHPYTHGLMASIPQLDQKKEKLPTIEGQVPPLNNLPTGCAFYERCEKRKPDCQTIMPELLGKQVKGHRVRCFYPYFDLPTPKGDLPRD